MGGHKFAERICDLMGWEVNPKKTNDGGIDGWANDHKVPIQIKNHRNKVGRPDLQKFLGAMNGSHEGIFVAWDCTPSCYDYIIGVQEEFAKKIILKKVDEIIGDLLIPFDKYADLNKLFEPYKEKIEPDKIKAA